ncbi:MAG: ABC transporter permease [Deltaproteobacteria bacterium]|nr:ABC transporter permease [Deltaproteobacteria bacterium]
MSLAARLGTKNAAEIATMRARERLSALAALGVDVERTILAPRALAIFLSGLLFFPLFAVVILGSAFSTAALIGDQNMAISYFSLVEYTPATDVLQGILRMWLFSGCVGLLSTFFGNASGKDSRSLAKAVFASSVSGMTAIVTVNLYLSFLGAPQ